MGNTSRYPVSTPKKNITLPNRNARVAPRRSCSYSPGLINVQSRYIMMGNASITAIQQEADMCMKNCDASWMLIRFTLKSPDDMSGIMPERPDSRSMS